LLIISYIQIVVENLKIT